MGGGGVQAIGWAENNFSSQSSNGAELRFPVPTKTTTESPHWSRRGGNGGGGAGKCDGICRIGDEGGRGEL